MQYPAAAAADGDGDGESLQGLQEPSGIIRVFVAV